MNRKQSILFLLTLASLSANAQTADTLSLQEVVVTGTRNAASVPHLPMTVTVIDRQTLTEHQLTWTQIYSCVGSALNVKPNLYYVASEFLAAVAPKEWDYEGNLLGDKSVSVCFDCTKLKRAVPGFHATTRFDEGVRRAVAYILDHRELQISDPAFDAWCDNVIAAQEQAKQMII